MNQNLNIFKVTDDNNIPLNFDINSIGRFGFIIPRKYEDKIIYLPSNVIEEKVLIHHASILKFTLGKLFKHEKDNFFESFINTISGDNDLFYMDSEEIAYSSFIASLDSIVFVNTSTDYIKSGIIFIPKTLSKDDSRIGRLNEITNYLRKEKNVTSYVVVVPSLDEVLNADKNNLHDFEKNNTSLKVKEIPRYHKLLIKNKNIKRRSINDIR